MDKRLMTLFFLFLLSFTLFITLVVFNQPLNRLIRADQSATIISPEKSHINIWPLEVKADGKSESIIQVFLTAVDNSPIIVNKRVIIKSSLGQFRETEQTLPISNNNKFYTFYLSSNESGRAQVEVDVDGKVIKAINVVNFTK
jgi:hypothetical protein